MPLLLAVPLWVIVTILGLIAVMRIVAWDHFELFAVLNCVTAFVYLPAWLVAPVALFGRRPFLAGAAALVVVAQIAFMIPELTAAEPLPSWVTHAETIRVFDANVYNANPSMAGYAREIKVDHPQLLTMEEASPVDARQLNRAGALDGLPYRFDIPRYDPFAFFIASAYPLTATRVVYLFGRPLIVQTTLELPGGPLSLWVLHTVAPLPISFIEWQDQLSTVAHLLGERGPKGLLLVGDFNATWGSRGFHEILDEGMVDGAAARGHPFDMTWSQIKPVIPPVVRIDHMLTGPGVAVTTIRTGTGPGSDHRDLMGTVAIKSDAT